jgi:hypothetical protein
LHAVFVEDDDLLRLAELPFARQVSLGGGVEPWTVQRAQRQLRALAEYARREFETVARRLGVTSSFDIVRGVAGSAIAQASASDFLVAGTATRAIGRYFRVEHRWWAAASPVATSFLLASRVWGESGPVVALLTARDDAGERLIEAAAQLAAASGERLVVVCPAALAEEEGIGAWLADHVAGLVVPVEIDIAPSDPAILIRRLAALGCWLVALSAADPLAQPAKLRDLTGRLDCDVLVVR